MVTLKEAIGDLSSIPVPSYGHLKAYGCRAYPLTTEVKRGKERKRKLKPRAHIGYLVGYDSTNIFRIWVPALSKVIHTRDVTFNEDLFFDPKSEDLTAQLVAELKPLVQQVSLPEALNLNPSLRLLHDIQDEDLYETHIEDTIMVATPPGSESGEPDEEESEEDSEDEESDKESTEEEAEQATDQLPTPELTPAPKL